MPFKQAARMLGALLGVQISAETARRLTERMGVCVEAAQTAEADLAVLHESTDPPAPERCVVSVDGAMISLVHQQWVEVRTLAIGQPQKQRQADGELEVHVDQLSYFSRLADASTFTELADGEVGRRRVREAQEVCVVTDGADWCQAFPERHRPDALRILDFPHAAEHLSKLLDALKETGLPVPAQLLQRCLHILKHRGPGPLLRLADQLGSELAQRKGIQEHLDYLRKREALMHYPQFRDQGWPIGSGMVESANKNVVEVRLKGAGMHWERSHVNPMLALRTAVCNERWQERWRQALTHHRKQQALSRSARAKPRRATLLSGGDVSSQASSPVSSAAVSEHLAPPAPPPPSVREASQPSPCRLASRRTRQGVKRSGHNEAGRNADVCLCGRPLVRFKGHRPKQYCSDRCRMRAHRKRQATISSPGSPHRLKPAAHWKQTRLRAQRSRQPFMRKDAQTCPCGTPLVRQRGHRPREYCSGRCRQHAHRERHRQVL
jgi:hypothetical protein